jgi:uncharacterized membrane protein
MDLIRITALALFSFVVEPALAGTPSVPGPIVGLGLPALTLIGGAYWLGRKCFGHKR